MWEVNEQEYKRFVELLPLTLALAGLPPAEHGRFFTEDQLESRAMTVRKAYNRALELVRQCCAANRPKS
jgi:hypothetical protein